LYQVTRHAFPEKTFRQRRPNGNGGWIRGTKGVAMVPYHLPELTEAIALEQLVFIVEGEKDVDNLIQAGAPATCNPRGAGKWASCKIDSFFTGADVIIIADNDPQAKNKKTGELLVHPDGRPRFAGWDHAHEVAAHLAPIAVRVRLIDLKRLWPDCPEKGDISDWLAAGGTLPLLYTYAEELNNWTPADALQPPALIKRQAKVYLIPDPAGIPPRAWLFGRHYMRSIVSATVAPGGFGKSTLAIHEALSMVRQGLRVWYISAEDDFNEMHRRIAAYMLLHNVPADEVNGRLFVDDKTSFPLKIAHSERNGFVFDKAALIAFEQAIEDEHIDVAILDPFISFHAVAENDTAAMDAVVKRFGEIATRQSCCIELSHHVRKPPSTGPVEITVYDARGAGAIVNAVRSCRVLNQMSHTLAEQAGILDKDRCRYIRIDSGKRNMAPPEAAKWMRLESVELANGDYVQALSNYIFKPQATSIDDDRRWLRTVMANDKAFRVAAQSGQWLGKVMAEHFGRNVDVKGDRIWLQKTIKRWADDGLIREIKQPDETRRMRPYWVLGDLAEDDAVEAAADFFPEGASET
jgi:AAA domain